jgi:hypothetical protein
MSFDLARDVAIDITEAEKRQHDQDEQRGAPPRSDRENRVTAREIAPARFYRRFRLVWALFSLLGSSALIA